MSNKRIQKKRVKKACKALERIFGIDEKAHLRNSLNQIKQDEEPKRSLYYVKPTAEYSKYDSRKLH